MSTLVLGGEQSRVGAQDVCFAPEPEHLDHRLIALDAAPFIVENQVGVGRLLEEEPKWRLHRILYVIRHDG